MKKPEIILRLLRIPLDFLSVVSAFLIAYHWRSTPEWVPFVSLSSPNLMPFENFVVFALQAAMMVVVLFSWERMYGLKSLNRLRKEFRRMMTITGAAYTIIILYFFIVGITFFSRFILGVSFLMTIFLMISHRFILRILQHFLWKRGVGRRRVLFVGDGRVLEELAQIWDMDSAFDVFGRLDYEKKSVPAGMTRIVGTYDDLHFIVQKSKIDEVVQVGDIKESAELVEYCQLNHVEYRFVPNMLEVQRTNTEIDFVRDIPLITLRSTAINGWGRVVKRSVDIIGSVIGLVLFSPLMFFASFGILCQDGGPVMYKSKRVSKNKTFWMWKFRTMIKDADKMKSELQEQNRREGPLFKIEHDPRITWFGRFLRKTSLDELPQLWNVLTGDISLVGPRAHLPEEIEQYEKHHRRVLVVKAGVTGLPQVSGRSRLDFEQEVKLDVYYLENWSLWLDLKIIVKTFGVVFDGE
ncbi:MAG: sugar transferase [Candidatus Gracilibacteria bacterium]|nr:sugar transferase [Candidatus Gracilibacteria bacterium]